MMQKTIYLLLLFPFLTKTEVSAQFQPQAGEQGSTAMHKDSSAFIAWASNCTVTFGLKDIARPELGQAGVGSGINATGKAGTNGTVSLGDRGAAVLTFDKPVTNGNGADFAVFENGFRDNSTRLDFLEYAFVEVSSDGHHFYKFPSRYAGDTVNQVEPFQTTDTRKYHNLAGKYVAPYGTPFDLQELAGIEGLDINYITHIRVTDICGTVNPAFASRDSEGKKINDPYPTDFASGGFDLDAIGVIHQTEPLLLNDQGTTVKFAMFPNPAEGNVRIVCNRYIHHRLKVTDITGTVIREREMSGDTDLDISSLTSGTYLISVSSAEGTTVQKLTVK